MVRHSLAGLVVVASLLGASGHAHGPARVSGNAAWTIPLEYRTVQARSLEVRFLP